MKVKFLPQDVEYEIKPNQSVMNVAHENGIHIQSVCKGIPSCAECRVKVVEGSTNVLPPFADELDLIGTAHFVDQRRLSCQLRCFGDLTVDLSEQIDKESVSTMQPKGRIKKESGESVARLGNILDENEAPQLEYDDEEAKDVLKETPAPVKKESRENKKQGHNHKNKHKSGGGNRSHKNNKNRNHSQKKASASGQQKDQKSSGGGNEGGARKNSNKKRRNNRNRNRNNNKNGNNGEKS